jgi:hypothetical protein
MRVGAIILVGCGLSVSACGSPAEQGAVAENFSALYAEVFVPKGCVGCHDADAPGGLDMSSADGSYQALVGAPAQGTKCAPAGTLRVAAGDSDGSLLVHKLEGHDATSQPVCGKPMPQKEQLEASQIERVRNWIDQGAESGDGE